MRLLIAFDKFKESMTARQACEAAAQVLTEIGVPESEIEVAPLTDGGEGFCEILTLLAEGCLHEVEVTGPLGEQRAAPWGEVQLEALPQAAREQLELPATGTLGIIEMARASGLELVPAYKRSPWETTTRGTGELLQAAVQAGVDAVLLGIGGSATNDCGLGALEALGLVQTDKSGKVLSPSRPGDWPRVVAFAGQLPVDLPALRIACDVNNPLLGSNGATAIYGPQKGLKSDDYKRLEALMESQARRLCAFCERDTALMERPGAGAAGGVGFGLMAGCGAQLVPGFPLVSAWLDLEAKVARADVVLTGEGRFDKSSLQGKGPGSVIEAASQAGKPVSVFAGKLESDAAESLTGFGQGITPEGMPLKEAFRRAPELLAAAVDEWARTSGGLVR
ncbi:MAG: glycerate kinase [Opitutales bacterium]